MSRGKQPKLSSQRRHLLEPHDAGTHTQEELAELPDVLFGLRVMRKPLGRIQHPRPCCVAALLMT
jgi:hypothetical protein